MIDSTFMHYGVRREDMQIIKEICDNHELDFDWFKDEVLRQYHEDKMSNEDMDSKNLQKIIKKAMDKYNF